MTLVETIKGRQRGLSSVRYRKGLERGYVDLGAVSQSLSTWGKEQTAQVIAQGIMPQLLKGRPGWIRDPLEHTDPRLLKQAVKQQLQQRVERLWQNALNKGNDRIAQRWEALLDFEPKVRVKKVKGRTGAGWRVTTSPRL